MVDNHFYRFYTCTGMIIILKLLQICQACTDNGIAVAPMVHTSFPFAAHQARSFGEYIFFFSPVFVTRLFNFRIAMPLRLQKKGLLLLKIP